MKVILTIIDGMAFHLVDNFLYHLNTLYKFSQEGVYSRLESVYPAITPIALASLFTGLQPKNHGIVAPKIFVKGRKLSHPLTAYNSSSLTAEPIWSILGKKGYKVLVTSAPQALPDKWKLDNVILFDPYKSKIKKCTKGYVIKEGENRILGNKWNVKIDNNTFYITLPDGKEVKLAQGEWSNPIEFNAKCGGKDVNGIAFLHAREKDIYLTPPSFFTDWSNNKILLEEVWKNIALKEGIILDGDYKSLNKGLISFEEYMKTVELSYNFFYKYTEYLLTKTSWDFAITYLPTIDNLQHLLYGIDDSRALDAIFNAYKLADKFVELNSRYADTIFICSDHGISKIRKKIYINKILEKINVLKIEDGKIDWRRTKAFYGGGGIIRINLKDREENGIVSKEEFPKLVKYIVRNLENIVDDGEKVFTRIYEKESPAGDREGDIEITPRYLYGMSSDVESTDDEIIKQVIPYKTSTGDHGYFRKEDMYGAFFAYGDKIRKTREKMEVRIIDIAPTILKLFNVQNKKSDGRALVEVLRL